MSEEDDRARAFRGLRAGLEAREPRRRQRIVKTPSGFVQLSFFGKHVFASEFGDDGWPTRNFVRPLRRGDERLIRILRRRGLSTDEARVLAAQIADEWPETAPSFPRLLAVAAAQMVLAVVGWAVLARTLLARLRRA